MLPCLRNLHVALYSTSPSSVADLVLLVHPARHCISEPHQRSHIHMIQDCLGVGITSNTMMVLLALPPLSLGSPRASKKPMPTNLPCFAEANQTQRAGPVEVLRLPCTQKEVIQVLVRKPQGKWTLWHPPGIWAGAAVAARARHICQRIKVRAPHPGVDVLQFPVTRLEWAQLGHERNARGPA